MKTLINTQRFNDLIYDVGMNTGQDTEFYLKKGFRIVAFEADPDLVIHNRRKFSDEIEYHRLEIVEGAIVADTSHKQTTFYKNLDNNKWGTIDTTWAFRGEKLRTQFKIVKVNSTDFTSCIERFGIPYYRSTNLYCVSTINTVIPHYDNATGTPKWFYDYFRLSLTIHTQAGMIRMLSIPV